MSRNIKREPVHARLGIKLNTQQRNRVQHFGTNTSSLMPKKRKRRNRGPKNQAQKRLNDIRKNLQNNMQKKTFHIQNLSNNSNNNNKQTFFKLRRQIAEPSDLTIHVNNVNHGNSTFVNNNRFKLMLNQQLQNQIKRIQQRVQDHELNMNIRKVTPVSTNIALNERFTFLT